MYAGEYSPAQLWGVQVSISGGHIDRQERSESPEACFPERRPKKNLPDCRQKRTCGTTAAWQPGIGGESRNRMALMSPGGCPLVAPLLRRARTAKEAKNQGGSGATDQGSDRWGAFAGCKLTLVERKKKKTEERENGGADRGRGVGGGRGRGAPGLGRRRWPWVGMCPSGWRSAGIEKDLREKDGQHGQTPV